MTTSLVPWHGQFTLSIDTSAYAALDQIGELQTITGAAAANGGGGFITNARVTDKDKEKAALYMWAFQENPTITSSDNGALDVTDANANGAEVLPGPIIFDRYYDLSNNSFATGWFQGGQPMIQYVCPSGGTSIYFIMQVGVGAAPTYTAGTDLTIDVWGFQLSQS